MIDLWALGLTLFGCILGSVGTVLIKKGAAAFSLKKFWVVFTDKFLFSGLSLFTLSLVFYLVALRWEELSVLYPVVSVSYVFVTLLSVKFLGEKINFKKGLGLACLIFGIILISLSR